MTPESRTVPAGWYPDPAGAPAWRAWNGTSWSKLIVHYPAPRVVRPTLALSRTTWHLSTWGLATYLTGVALAVWSFSVTLSAHMADRPLSASTTTRLDAVLFLGAVMTTWGTVVVGRSIAALRDATSGPRPRPADWIPVLNLVIWTLRARHLVDLPFDHTTVILLLLYNIYGLVHGLANHHLVTSNILVGLAGLLALFLGTIATDLRTLIERWSKESMSDTPSRATL